MEEDLKTQPDNLSNDLSSEQALENNQEKTQEVLEKQENLTEKKPSKTFFWVILALIIIVGAFFLWTLLK